VIEVINLTLRFVVKKKSDVKFTCVIDIGSICQSKSIIFLLKAQQWYQRPIQVNGEAIVTYILRGCLIELMKNTSL
jgi:hypothetical protein